MKKLIFFLLTIPLWGLSQGLNYESSYNSSHYQTPNKSTTTNAFTYLTYFENHQNGNELYLQKSDTNGQVYWRKNINPTYLDFVYIKSIFELSNGNLVIIGDGQEVCDVGGLFHHFLMVLNSNGNIIHQYDAVDFDSEFYYGIKSAGINKSREEIYFSIDKIDTSKIFSFDFTNFQIDSILISVDSISEVNQLNNSNFLIAKKDSLIEIDFNSQIVQTLNYTTPIQSVQERNDSLFILTSDSVFIYNNTLNLLQRSNISTASELRQLSLDNTTIHVLNNNNGAITTYDLDPNLQITNSTSISLNNYQNDDCISFCKSNLNHIQDFSLYEKTAVRHFNYSLKDATDSTITYPDVTIVDIEKESIHDLSMIAQNTYNFDLQVKVQIQNNSNEVLNSVRINHYITIWYCGDVYYSQEFNNLNILPGGSQWITLDPIFHQETISGNPITYEFCAYTSHPNRKTDLNVSNDNFCESIQLGFVGNPELNINKISIYPNPATDYITITSDTPIQQYKILNTMGQQVQEGRMMDSRIEVKTIPSGYYIIELKVGDQLISKKLIIE